MISQDEAQKIRDIYQRSGSIAETARQTGHHRSTIKAVLTRDYSAKPKRTRIPSRWDRRIKDLLTQSIPLAIRSKKFRITPKRIHTLLASEGCALSLRQIERRVKALSEKLFSSTSHDAFLRIESFPGCWQADYCNVFAIVNGIMLPLCLFLLSSAYSNACVGVCSRSQCAACFFHSMEVCFAALGGVPPVIRFDNLSPAVKFIRTKRIKTDAFSRFEIHHGFVSEFCNPYHGNEKGNVEQKVKYIRQNFFVPLPAFPSINAANQALENFLVDDTKRRHYARKKAISALLQDEKNCFLPLQSSFDFWDVKTASVSKQGFIMYDGNFYFTAPKCASMRVTVKANHELVVILDDAGLCLNFYPRSFDAGAYLQNASDLASMLARKPTALKYVLPNFDADEAFSNADYNARARMIRRFLR